MKKTLSNIIYLVLAAFLIWVGLSFANTVLHNLNMDSISIASWNLFEIMFGR